MVVLLRLDNECLGMDEPAGAGPVKGTCKLGGVLELRNRKLRLSGIESDESFSGSKLILEVVEGIEIGVPIGGDDDQPFDALATHQIEQAGQHARRAVASL